MDQKIEVEQQAVEKQAGELLHLAGIDKKAVYDAMERLVGDAIQMTLDDNQDRYIVRSATSLNLVNEEDYKRYCEVVHQQHTDTDDESKIQEIIEYITIQKFDAKKLADAEKKISTLVQESKLKGK